MIREALTSFSLATLLAHPLLSAPGASSPRQQEPVHKQIELVVQGDVGVQQVSQQNLYLDERRPQEPDGIFRTSSLKEASETKEQKVENSEAKIDFLHNNYTLDMVLKVPPFSLLKKFHFLYVAVRVEGRLEDGKIDFRIYRKSRVLCTVDGHYDSDGSLKSSLKMMIRRGQKESELEGVFDGHRLDLFTQGANPSHYKAIVLKVQNECDVSRCVVDGGDVSGRVVGGRVVSSYAGRSDRRVNCGSVLVTVAYSKVGSEEGKGTIKDQGAEEKKMATVHFHPITSRSDYAPRRSTQ